MRRPPLRFSLLVGCFALVVSVKEGPSAAAPAGTVLDEGTFRLSVGGTPAGDETFRLVDEGGQRRLVTKSTVREPGGEVHVEATLIVDHKFRPISGIIRHTAGDVTRSMILSRKGNVLSVKSGENGTTIEDKDKNKPSDLFVHDLVVSHLAPVCVLGGPKEKVLRRFPGIDFKVGPADLLEIQTEAGAKRKLTYFKIQNPGGAVVELLCDGPKLVLLRQQANDLLATREGYEDVAEKVVKVTSMKPDLPASLQELERKVKAPGGLVLSCSLVLPAERRSPLPAVIMLNGTGAQDRDADSPPGGPIRVALFKHLAIVLGMTGIASLRCDDPGVGKSTPRTAMATFENLVADASSMLGELRAQPGIDPGRIGVIGHERGADVAAVLAARDKELKAAVLLSAVARTLDQVNIEERDRDMRAAGVKAAEIAKEHKRFARMYAAIRAGKPLPADLSDEDRKAIEPLVPYLASMLRFDAQKVLRGVKIPVFIGRGGKDEEVTARDAKLLQQALLRGGNHRAVVKDYPELSHFFTPVKTGTLADFSNPTLEVDLAFLGDLAKFLQGAL